MTIMHKRCDVSAGERTTVQCLMLGSTDITLSFHPSIFYTRLIRRSGRGGGWNLSQQSLGEKDLSLSLTWV